MGPSRWCSTCLAILLVVLLLSVIGYGQTDRAAVSGDVTDPTGAVVPNVKVRILNVATGGVYETKTDGTGHYATPAVLKPGRYKVEVSHEGFKTATSTEITLQIGSVRVVNVPLAVGAATENVTVTAQAPLLETETSSRGEVITGRQITELPLKDRNFTQLATLTPGVTRAYTGILTDAQQFNQGDANAGSPPGGSDSRGSTESARFSRSGGAALSANGLRPTNNNFSLDGVDNNEPQFGSIGVFPNPDAIQEFKVETSVGKAETGRGGANFNVTYQSGGNAFHGSAYYYGQNDALNATHPQILRNRADLIAGGSTPAQAEALQPQTTTRIHEFGFTFSGPIIKNRTFFFGDYLGQRNSIPNFFRTVVPTAKSRNGDFSEFSTPVLDPRSAGCTVPGNATGGGCTAFAGNNVANFYGSIQNHPNFSPQGFALFALYPLPTINVLNPGQGNENFFGTRANRETINSFDVKVDHRLSTNNNLSFRYTRDNQQRVRANFFPKVPTAGFGAGNELGNTRQIVVSDTHAFSPRLLNDFRFGWTHIDIGIFNCGVGGACGISPTICSDLGIPNCNKGTLPTSGGILTGGFGTGFFEFTGDGGLFDVKSNNFYIADSVTVISGKHTWKAGVEIRPRHLDTIDGGRSGFLKGHLNYGDGGTQNAQANILFSQPAPQAGSGTVSGGDKPFNLRTTEWSLFVQDDWKVTSRLTVNLGLRYDVFPSFKETQGRLANFDVAAATIVKADGSGDRILDTSHNNIGPRVGFAYTFGPERDMVLRGGYGIFYTQDGVDYPPLVRNPPETASVEFDSFSSPITPNFNLSTGPPVATITDPPVLTSNSVLFAQQQDQKLGTIHEWNVTWQWEFARDYVLDLGYAGTRGRHLLATRQIGRINNGLGSAVLVAGASCALLPATCINDVTAYENRTSSNYDALQARLVKRFSHHVQGSFAYTWSHNIDDSGGVFTSPGDQRNGAFGPINPLDFRRDRGTSSLDRRHVISTNIIWDLPFGRGRHFGNGVSQGWDRVIGGWQTNLLFSGATGQPFSAIGDCNGCQGGGTVAVLLPGADPFSGAPPGRFLNPAAFAPASTNPLQPGFVGTTCVTNLAGNRICFGNTGRNQFVGPGVYRVDFSVFKNAAITERVRMQFGIEAFNLFNRNDPVVPQNNISNGDFGQFRTGLPGRTMQYRIKVLF